MMKGSRKTGNKKPATHTLRFTVNGTECAAEVKPSMLLADFIRDELGLTGTHIGCDTSNCGACTVLVDGRNVKSCTMLAVQADGSKVTTIEGLARGNTLHPIQEAFVKLFALQCGYCTPGMIMSAHALLTRNPDPTEEEIRIGLSGNLCRCTGYKNIVAAVVSASKMMRGTAEPTR